MPWVCKFFSKFLIETLPFFLFNILVAFIISSFGVMMVIAFLLGNYLLRKDVIAEGYDAIIADDIIFRAAIGGIIGAKIYYLIENIPTGQAADNINGLINIS